MDMVEFLVRSVRSTTTVATTSTTTTTIVINKVVNERHRIISSPMDESYTRRHPAEAVTILSRIVMPIEMRPIF